MLAGFAAQAQTTAAAPPADPVIATVNGKPIHMSDVQIAAQNLPAQMQQLSPQQLFPLIVNQLIDRQALLVAAKSEKLQNNPQVAAAMEQAADEKLENAYVQEKVAPQITDATVAAAYKAEYTGKPGPEQVQARHILVKTEAQAKSIIEQLNHGASFAKLAQKDSIDPGAANGGELGWFAQNQMVPAFANAAFALKPGQYTKTPVQSQFGWHVILCEGRRTQPTPSLADVKDQISQDLAQQAIKTTLADARSKVTIQVFNADGSPAASDANSDGMNVNLNPGGQ
jgi:peptidyl-prolyl cis-trans isomerase C